MAESTAEVGFGWAALPHAAFGGMVGGLLGGSLFTAAGVRLTHNQ